VGKNWLLVTVLGFAIAGVVGLAIWWGYSRLIVMGAARRTPGSSPRVSPFRFGGVSSKVPLWRMWSGAIGKSKQSYELVGQHDA